MVLWVDAMQGHTPLYPYAIPISDVKYETTCVLFVCSYDDSVYSEWSGKVDEVASASLEKSLLLRDPVVLHLTVNFDPKVILTLLGS